MKKKANCEICKKPFEFLDKHHIHSLSLGGYNSSWNIAHICCNCHRLTHKGKVILEGRFITSDGERLVWRLFNKPSITGVDDPPVYIIGK